MPVASTPTPSNTPVPGTFNFPLPSYGYLSAVIITLNATGGSGSTAVYYEDAPWTIISSPASSDAPAVEAAAPHAGD
jgi:hypothetical protein